LTGDLVLDVPALARTIELAEAHGIARAVAACGGEDLAVEPLGQARLVYDGPGSPRSVALGLGWDGPVTAEVMDQVEGFFADRGEVPRLHLCPHADPSLNDLARERGFGIQRFMDVLYRPIAADEDLDPDPGAAVVVRRVDPEDQDQVERIARLVARGFADGADPGPDDLRLERLLITQPGGATFVAELDGQPVGAGTCALGGGGVALFAASVLPELRRRGAQRALIRARMRHGRENGATFATVGASPGAGTRRNAERLGFRLLYTRPTLVRGT
jgi:GNAT superfamily N-acetyltransferase